MFEAIIETINYDSWKDFVNKFEGFPHKNNKYLFRGQSNYFQNHANGSWKPYSLKTTFQREFGLDESNLFSVLKRFMSQYEKYYTLRKLDLKNTENFLPLILYLRHAGVPMPVLDVTFDPFTALYFAVNDLSMSYGVQNSIKKDDERYVSVYEFDKDILTQYYEAKEITEIFFLQDGITDTPLLITKVSQVEYPNKNMIRQNGAFIFISSNYGIDILLNAKKLSNPDNYRHEFPKPMKHHRINYGSIFPDITKNSNDDVYKFLYSKKKSGFELFEDEQALIFDFKNPHYIL